MTFIQILPKDFSPNFQTNHTIVKLNCKDGEFADLKIRGGVFLDVDLKEYLKMEKKKEDNQLRKSILKNIERKKVIAITNPFPSLILQVTDGNLYCNLFKKKGERINDQTVKVTPHRTGVDYLRVKIIKDTGSVYELDLLLLVMNKVGYADKQPYKGILDTQVNQSCTNCPITCPVCPSSLFSHSKLWLECTENSSFPQNDDGILDLPSTFYVCLMNWPKSSTLFIGNCNKCSIDSTPTSSTDQIEKFKVSLSPTCSHWISIELSGDFFAKVGPFKHQPNYIHSIQYGSPIEEDLEESTHKYDNYSSAK